MKKFESGKVSFSYSNGDIIIFSRFTTKRMIEKYLRNNIPEKRIVKHLYASHQNDCIAHFKATCKALRSGQYIADPGEGKKLYYPYQWRAPKVVEVHFNMD